MHGVEIEDGTGKSRTQIAIVGFRRFDTNFLWRDFDVSKSKVVNSNCEDGILIQE